MNACLGGHSAAVKYQSDPRFWIESRPATGEAAPMEVERTKYIIWAADMNRALTFYRDALGATVTRESEVISEVEIAGAVIGIHGGGDGKKTWTGMSFQVADVVEGAKEIVAAGGQLSREPTPDEPGELPHLAMCIDPEGNEIMLTRKRG
ncbi:MAG: VOC family protein [Roseibacillus sp.]